VPGALYQTELTPLSYLRRSAEVCPDKIAIASLPPNNRPQAEATHISATTAVRSLAGTRLVRWPAGRARWPTALVPERARWSTGL
jgi:hypothetical protein